MDWINVLGLGKAEIEDIRYVAYSYIKQGVYDVALTFFDALRVLEPSNAYDLQTTGAIYLQMNDPVKALDFLDRALKLDPNHLATKLNRSKALLMLGLKKQAFSVLDDLQKCKDVEIRQTANAIMLAYR